MSHATVDEALNASRSRHTREMNRSLNGRPDYARIHAQQLPVIAHPLPTFHPTNPISWLHFAFILAHQTIYKPHSHQVPLLEGYFSPETKSVHVTNPKAIRFFWEKGFFGKGSLSRSEPTWLDEEKRLRGLVANETATEISQKRREERRQFKDERARKEREAIELQMQMEQQAKAAESQQGLLADPAPRSSMDMQFPNYANGQPSEDYESPSTPNGHLTGNDVNSEHVLDEEATGPKPTIASKSSSNQLAETAKPNSEADWTKASTTPQLQPNPEESPRPKARKISTSVLQNQEHLQLDLSEAFFLCYALGALKVYPSSAASSPLTTSELLNLFRRSSYFPTLLSREPSQVHLHPDDPFLLNYVAYHHFRSLGWVVRAGVKFSIDMMLYNRGPPFSHAQFAVLVSPSYNHSYWTSSEAGRQHAKKKDRKDWWWLHCMNRVQNQVLKSLVLCYVEVPPPFEESVENVGAMLKRYKIREFIIDRWLINRSRD